MCCGCFGRVLRAPSCRVSRTSCDPQDGGKVETVSRISCDPQEGEGGNKKHNRYPTLPPDLRLHVKFNPFQSAKCSEIINTNVIGHSHLAMGPIGLPLRGMGWAERGMMEGEIETEE